MTRASEQGPAADAARVLLRPCECHRRRGASAVEILVVATLVVVIGASGLGAWRELRDRQAGREAARVLMHDLQEVAVRARTSGRARAVRFSTLDAGASWEEFEDGNGNGVRVAEVDAAVDPRIGPPRATFREGRGRLAIDSTIPTTDHAGTLPAGSSAVRFGIAPFIVFTPRRTASSGSLYVAGPDGRHYAIRILGTTQRWRLLCLDDRAFAWKEC